MDTYRTLTRRTRSGPLHAGFAGPGHTAAEIVGSHMLPASDPFVFLMDDRIDFAPGQQIGGGHPHAGLETVTLVLEGAQEDDEEGRLHTGDVAWMTAGRGVIHNDHARVPADGDGHLRIFQLWVALPTRHRNASPRLQLLPLSSLPVRREPGVQARLYSGRSGDLVSPTRNHVPITLVDFMLDANARVGQQLPAHYRGFVQVVSGEVRIGDEVLEEGDTGWFDPLQGDDTQILLQAGSQGAHAVLYAGQPLNEPIVHHGPFVAGSRTELVEFFDNFQNGAFPHLGQVPDKVTH